MRNLITHKSFLITSLFAVGALHAQDAPKAFGQTLKASPSTGLVRCVSAEYMQDLQSKNANMQTEAQFEAWLAPKIAARKAQKLTTNAAEAVITLPVVVHIIHNGDAVGSNENISDDQVLSQITVLNQDYRRLTGSRGYNENEVGADVGIEFCLAQVDPDGNPTTGIDRQRLSAASWSTSTIEATLKPQTIWDPTKYFNIWVCNFGGDLADVLGYSTFPQNSTLAGLTDSSSTDTTDGVIIGYKYFGSKEIYANGTYDTSGQYIYGRTATHEIGHYLGLRHVDGDNTSCVVNATDSRKDYCPDTPAINELHYTCVSEDSCPDADGTDMIENYMDYTPDSCMNIFTVDQKDRIVTVLQNADRRKTLLTSTVCQATTAGTQQFKALNGVNLYPNPAQTVINIAIASGDLPDNYTVLNSLGQVVAKAKVTSTANLSINTSAYSNGIYFIKIDKGSETKTLKFIKN